ncbi:MAG TPA: VWA domain-containing protein, partial [Pyrinomonadaceae bacterium]|nr:VWA domain-containing protein [Pyrinomonadaceae bacterium]
SPLFGKTRIEVEPASKSKRIDLTISVPERTRLKIITDAGEIRVSGNPESVEAATETGTIAVAVPADDIKYSMQWTEARPRFLADFDLSKVREKAAGRFEIRGHHQAKGDDETSGDVAEEKNADPPAGTDGDPGKDEKGDDKKEDRKEDNKEDKKEDKRVSLNFTTSRGIVLLNVPPNEVMSDLRERPLTHAAKAIIRSGDKPLMDAIRRASPKYFGEYEKNLPPMRREPSISQWNAPADSAAATVKQAIVRVTDIQNRSIAGLTAEDFEVTESGRPREIVSVRPVTAPVNLVLLLDVSGSVDNYVDFIRKAARSFVNTVNANDRISIVLFNDDVKVLSGFTTDKAKLSKSLDTFDAGGATAYYDAVAYTLAETLRPLKGERTAIVVLTDGDDNRSFLPFDSLAGAIEESGALIYPLYVPSSLIAAAATNPDAALDPVRTRYTGLTAKAEGEGEKLAKISGGVYYPISQLSQIQQAYDDIAVQLRTAYSVTFRSNTAADPNNHASPRLKIRVKKESTFATIGPVTVAGSN